MSVRRLAALLVAFAAPTAADACMQKPLTPEQTRAYVNGGRVVIIDGELVRPQTSGDAPARIQPHRVLRGPVRPFYEVRKPATTCERPLTRKGLRNRFVLSGGPDLYYLMTYNGSDADIDRALGSDRRADRKWWREPW